MCGNVGAHEECPKCEQRMLVWDAIFEMWVCSDMECGFSDRIHDEYHPPRRDEFGWLEL